MTHWQATICFGESTFGLSHQRLAPSGSKIHLVSDELSRVQRTAPFFIEKISAVLDMAPLALRGDLPEAAVAILTAKRVAPLS